MSRSMVCLASLGFLLPLCAGTGLGQQQEKAGEKGLPKELIGKWVVVEGPQEGALFEFLPEGKMIAKVNVNGNEGIINATVRVEDKKLLSTTKDPQKGTDLTRVLLIRVLTAEVFVVEDDQGDLWKMRRPAEGAKKS
jgi:uncharacterized protein (TIGR03066 family)